MKPARTAPSQGLAFNHQTLIKLIKANDSLKYWQELERDPWNSHLHTKAKFKVRWLERKVRLLRKVMRYD